MLWIERFEPLREKVKKMITKIKSDLLSMSLTEHFFCAQPKAALFVALDIALHKQAKSDRSHGNEGVDSVKQAS